MIYFIVNPTAGRGYGKATEDRLRSYLDVQHVEYGMYETQYHGHATALAEELCGRADCTALCAVGGDGTFFEVVSGLDTRIPLGLIPAGTGNDFVHGAKLSDEPIEALKAILTGRTKPFDYLEVNDRRCMNAAGLGFDIDVLERQNRYRKYIPGKLSYYVALLRSLFHFGGRMCHLVLDGETELNENVFMISMMNGKYIGGGMPISLDSQANDGVMDVIMIRMMPIWRIPGMFIKYMSGRIQDAVPYVSVHHCTEMTCSAEPSSRVQMDGEIMDLMPIRVRLFAGGLRILGASE